MPLPPLPPRPQDGHKGLFGRVLVLGGNDGMIGAPTLAATAALRTGSGLVQLAVPRSILHACLTITPELIGLGLGKSTAKDHLLEAAEAADSVVIGPGLGRTPEALARLQRLIRLDKPIVLDADALNLLATLKKWPPYFRARAALTPHPGEMKRLLQLLPKNSPFSHVPEGQAFPTDDDSRTQIALALAAHTHQTIVLKGHRTVIATADRTHINTTGNSALSKAGTGDVLSGILGSLLGQGMPPHDAAIAAVHIHGRTGELASQSLGLRSPLARDLLTHLPQALAEYESLTNTPTHSPTPTPLPN